MRKINMEGGKRRRRIIRRRKKRRKEVEEDKIERDEEKNRSFLHCVNLDLKQ
jgi:hypothetical protein